MRRCTRCGESKDPRDFYRKSATALRSDCKSCHKGNMRPRSKAHYKANRRYYLDRNHRYRKDIQKVIAAYKHNRPCADCRVKQPYWRLDFDHLPGSEKDASVAQIARRHSPRRILLEVAKCELVCANCHRDRTHRRAGRAPGPRPTTALRSLFMQLQAI